MPRRPLSRPGARAIGLDAPTRKLLISGSLRRRAPVVVEVDESEVQSDPRADEALVIGIRRPVWAGAARFAHYGRRNESSEWSPIVCSG